MVRTDGLIELIIELLKESKPDLDKRFVVEDKTYNYLLNIAGQLVAHKAIERGQDKAILGMDTRKHSPLVSQAFLEGLHFGGVQAIIAGVTTTPHCEYLGDYAGLVSVMVTASHMGKDETGLKIHTPHSTAGASLGLQRSITHTQDYDYAEKARGLLHARLDKIDNKKANVRVCIDSAHGSSALFLNDVLTRRGVAVVKALRDNVEPEFPTLHNNAPDPTKYQNLEPLSAAMEQSGADIGFFLDGDCDRTVAVLKGGRALDAAYMAGLFSRYLAGTERYVLDPMMDFLEPVLGGMVMQGKPVIAEKRGRPTIKKTIADKKAKGGAEFSYHFYDADGNDCGIANILRLIEMQKSDVFSVEYGVAWLDKYLPFYSPELRFRYGTGTPQLKQIEEQIGKIRTGAADCTVREEGGIVKIDDKNSYFRIRYSANEPGVVTAVFWNKDRDKGAAEGFAAKLLSIADKKFSEAFLKCYDNEIRARAEHYHYWDQK